MSEKNTLADLPGKGLLRGYPEANWHGKRGVLAAPQRAAVGWLRAPKVRMPDSRMPKQVFYGQLKEDDRCILRLKLLFKDRDIDKGGGARGPLAPPLPLRGKFSIEILKKRDKNGPKRPIRPLPLLEGVIFTCLLNDHIKQSMKKFNMNPANLKSNAADRSQWRQAVHDGASHFENERPLARIERSMRRHAGLPHPHRTTPTPFWCARNADEYAAR